MSATNHLGQPVGEPVPNWAPRPAPQLCNLTGRRCRLEPLDPGRHAEDLYRANGMDEQGRMWTYLSYGPFEDLGSYRQWLEGAAASHDPMFFAILAGEPSRAVGVASYLRVKPADGSIEVGHLAFSPALQRTAAATEAMALMMATAFDELGYRRYEWKCDALNAPSRRAALRLGFVYEGTFRQATVVRGRNRDTAWFSVTDAEWPRVKEALARWLAPGNFGPDGRQLVALSALTQPALTQPALTQPGLGPPGDDIGEGAP
ncbi:MAG: GNAT family N-acetyltransferase [Acidimicrobiales bacterium]